MVIRYIFVYVILYTRILLSTAYEVCASMSKACMYI